MGQVTELVGRGLAHFLTKPVRQSTQVATVSQEQLLANLQPGDVLLIEGNTRVSVATVSYTHLSILANGAS